MCYPKPGPRCSAHAAALLLKAKIANKQNNCFDTKVSLKEAQEAYDSTPAGQKELQRRIKQHKHSRNEKAVAEYADRLKTGAETRAYQLSLSGLMDKGDIRHSIPNKSPEREVESFVQNYDFDESVIPSDSTKMAQIIEDSTNWIHQLDTDEMEAVAWYTSSGSGTINNHLLGLDSPYNLGETADQIKTSVGHLDTALSKATHESPVKLWRGLPNEALEAMDMEPENFVEKYCAPGDIYKPGVFMSTTADFKTAVGFSGGVVFELKAKTAGSAVNVSAWGIRETEYITPRTAQYRVISVNKAERTISDRFTKEYHIIQLEEI